MDNPDQGRKIKFARKIQLKRQSGVSISHSDFEQDNLWTASVVDRIMVHPDDVKKFLVVGNDLSVNKDDNYDNTKSLLERYYRFLVNWNGPWSKLISNLDEIELATVIRQDSGGTFGARTLHAKCDYEEGMVMFEIFGLISGCRRGIKSVLLLKGDGKGTQDIWFSCDDRFVASCIRHSYDSSPRMPPNVRIIVGWATGQKRFPIVFAVSKRKINIGDQLFCDWLFTKDYVVDPLK